jgi:hypothetical protein
MLHVGGRGGLALSGWRRGGAHAGIMPRDPTDPRRLPPLARPRRAGAGRCGFSAASVRHAAEGARRPACEARCSRASSSPSKPASSLDPELQSHRAANYILALRAELLALARSCGVAHPALVTPEHIDVVSERYGCTPLAEVFGYEPGWPLRAPSLAPSA